MQLEVYSFPTDFRDHSVLASVSSYPSVEVGHALSVVISCHQLFGFQFFLISRLM